MGYLKSAGTVFIYVGLFLALVTFLPGIPPDAQFSEFSIQPPKWGLTDDTKLNNRLDDVEILFQGELKGPESFASYNGELYTSLHGGDVVKIAGKHIVPIVKFGKPCDGFWMEKECGRPLGLQFDKNGILYVVDTYNGIFKVDVNSGKYERVVDISKPIEGVIPRLANSLDIAANGDIYWSDSSSDFDLQNGVYTALANPSGRLIKYNAATKRNIVLVGNLGFANGLKLSKDESFVVVAETMVSRLTKFHLKGDKAGRAEPFTQGLPGLPDNIHSDGEDGFLVSLVVVADAEHPVITQSLSPHPYIRKMLARLLYLLEAPFKLVEDVYPNYYSKRAVHWIGHFESVAVLTTPTAGVVRIDAKGKVIDAAFSFSGKISGISSAYIVKDHIYLGSPYNEYLARLPLSRAFPSINAKTESIASEKVIEKREVKQATKPVGLSEPTTTASPTTSTTTPKPQSAPTAQKPAPPTTRQSTNTPSATITTTSTTATTTLRPPSQMPSSAGQPPTRPSSQQQQQQQATPKPIKSSEEVSPKSLKKVPASPPPPPSPSTKQPVRGTSPTQQGGQKQTGTEHNPNTDQRGSQQQTSKPVSNEQGVKNVKKIEDGAQKSVQNPSNAQKPPPPSNDQRQPPPSSADKSSKPVSASGQNIKDTEAKKSEQQVKPPVAAQSPPNSADKSSKPMSATGQNIKDTDAKKSEQQLKPPVAAQSPPRN